MIRRAVPEDAPDIARIFNQSIRPGAHATCVMTPVTAANRVEWITKHDDSAPAFVCVREGVIFGWASLSPFSPRPTLKSIAEISVYVDDSARGTHIGRELLIHLFITAKCLGVEKLVSITFAKNTPSLRGLKAAGFRESVVLDEIALVRGEWVTIIWLELKISTDAQIARFIRTQR